MRQEAAPLALVGLLLLAGCHPSPAPDTYLEHYPETECPSAMKGKLRLAVETMPLALPATGQAGDPALITHGMLARRIVISIAPSGLSKGDLLVQSRLKIRSVGGTFVGTLSLTTPHLKIDAADASFGKSVISQTSDAESATVETAPGEVLVTRDERLDASAIQTVIVDVLVKPGDQVVEDSVIHWTALWIDAQQPTPPERVKIDFSPYRHIAAKQMEVFVDHSFTLRRNDSKHVCAASAQATLVDHEAVRQPLWDIGVALPASGRQQFLSLSSAKLGVVRAVFASPTEAQSFLAWINATHATRVGDFELGIVSQIDGEPANQGSSAGAPHNPRFVEMRPEDAAQLKVGPLGEP